LTAHTTPLRREEETYVTATRRIALAFGVLYLVTFATSIPALLLFQPVLDDPVGYVANGGSDNRIYFGALLELLLIIANIGTAVVVYPILKRENHILSLGYVTARIVECTFILVGILAVLSIVSLSQENAGGEEGAIAYTLAEIKDWTFKLGPGWVVGIGNGLILGYLMLRPPGGYVRSTASMFRCAKASNSSYTLLRLSHSLASCARSRSYACCALADR
jgi:Domain of unknown function (DUF4386)